MHLRLLTSRQTGSTAATSSLSPTDIVVVPTSLSTEAPPETESPTGGEVSSTTGPPVSSSFSRANPKVTVSLTSPTSPTTKAPTNPVPLPPTSGTNTDTTSSSPSPSSAAVSFHTPSSSAQSSTDVSTPSNSPFPSPSHSRAAIGTTAGGGATAALLLISIIIFTRLKRRASTPAPVIRSTPFLNPTFAARRRGAHPSGPNTLLMKDKAVQQPEPPLPTATLPDEKVAQELNTAAPAPNAGVAGAGPSREAVLAQENVVLRAQIRQLEIQRNVLVLTLPGSTMSSEMPPDYEVEV